MKPLTVDREVYTRFIVEVVILAIKNKMPAAIRDMAYIQQDSTGLLITDYNQSTNLDQGHSDGRNIEMKSQSPNSPDFKILDSGFSKSIQSLQ